MLNISSLFFQLKCKIKNQKLLVEYMHKAFCINHFQNTNKSNSIKDFHCQNFYYKLMRMSCLFVRSELPSHIIIIIQLAHCLYKLFNFLFQPCRRPRSRSRRLPRTLNPGLRSSSRTSARPWRLSKNSSERKMCRAAPPGKSNFHLNASN